MREDGLGIVREVCVPANARNNIWTADFSPLTNQRFAAFVETVASATCGSTGGEAFVAERAIYLGPAFVAGHVNVGTPWIGTDRHATSGARLRAASHDRVRVAECCRTAGGEAVQLTGSGFAAGATVLIRGRRREWCVGLSATQGDRRDTAACGWDCQCHVHQRDRPEFHPCECVHLRRRSRPELRFPIQRAGERRHRRDADRVGLRGRGACDVWRSQRDWRGGDGFEHGHRGDTGPWHGGRSGCARDQSYGQSATLANGFTYTAPSVAFVRFTHETREHVPVLEWRHQPEYSDGSVVAGSMSCTGTSSLYWFGAWRPCPHKDAIPVVRAHRVVHVGVREIRPL